MIAEVFDVRLTILMGVVGVVLGVLMGLVFVWVLLYLLTRGGKT